MIPSVVPRTKMISRGWAAFTNSAIFFASFFIGIRCFLAQLVHAAMDIGILRPIKTRNAIDHRQRLLRRRAVVQINQRLTVRLGMENRKIRPDFLNVEYPIPERCQA